MDLGEAISPKIIWKIRRKVVHFFFLSYNQRFVFFYQREKLGTGKEDPSNTWLKPTFNRKHHELKYMSKAKSLLKFENPPFDEGERKKDDMMVIVMLMFWFFIVDEYHICTVYKVKAFQNFKNSLPSPNENSATFAAASSPQPKNGNVRNTPTLVYSIQS